ncbi:unnamed protein product [Albugo candida]|uniref:Peptidase A1 domain-containing protein n=1 Tax=Albugo candida TaxID=65357 RepID=A0A024FTG8_9STRA|nr:unnamed protein product [Albugo candida]|eukprot:CCI10212.1 unnamed protein product [Albugo candida]
MEQVRSFYQLVLGWFLLITRSSVNGCNLDGTPIQCNINPNNPSKYECTKHFNYMITSLKDLKREILDKTSVHSNCIKINIQFNGLEQFTITSEDLPPNFYTQTSAIITYKSKERDRFHESIKSQSLPIGYDLTQEKTRIFKGNHGEFTSVTSLLIDIGTKMFHLNPGQVIANDNEKVVFGLSELKQMQFAITICEYKEYDRLAIAGAKV